MYLTVDNETIIGASLSEPHTNGTALQDACVYMYDREAIYQKFKIGYVHFKFRHVLKRFKIHVQCKLTRWTTHY